MALQHYVEIVSETHAYYPSVTEGIVLVDKPPALTSFGVVARVRKATGVSKVGHAGTLDPFATGLLVVAVGRTYTRQLSYFQGLPKTYVVRMVLGMTTETLDRDGRILTLDSQFAQRGHTLADTDVLSVLPPFLGQISQVPPVYSAKKVAGKRLYEKAREGEVFTPQPSQVEVYQIDLLDFVSGRYPVVTLSVACGKGTYIRSLVRDVAAALDTVAYAKDLVRTRVGPWGLSDCIRV